MVVRTVRWHLLIVIFGALVGDVHGEKLSKAELIKRGKAATALVQAFPNFVGGTAICINPAGYFVTANGILPPPSSKGEVSLVFSAGLEEQKVLKARILRRNSETGLAILRVDGQKDFPTLPLGSAEHLTELTELFAFGFQTGVPLAIDKPEYPSISVSSGQVTTLRRKGGELRGIGIKGLLEAGQMGAPLVDEEGKVLGVLIRGGGPAAEAASSNLVTQLLAEPDIQLSPTAISGAEQHQPLEFQARVAFLRRSEKPFVVELVLQAGDGPERRLTMENKDGAYRVSAVPVPRNEPMPLELTASFESGSVTGLTNDRSLQVGEKKVPLGGVTRIRFQPKLAVVLRDGKVLEEVLTGLDPLTLAVGGQTFKVDLGLVNALEVQPPREVTVLTCTVIVREDGKEVGRLRTRVPLSGRLVEPADPRRAAIHPTDLSADRVEKMLPDLGGDIEVGGAGRYLIVHLPRLKRLAVFDVNEGRITRHIPTTQDKVFFAAGLEKLVVGLHGKNVLERWDLATGEKEQTAGVVVNGDLSSVLLGSASHGPVVVNGAFHDLRTLKPIQIELVRGAPTALHSLVASDGTVFGSWQTEGSPGICETFVLQGDQLQRYAVNDVGHVVPGPDGKVVYTAMGPRSVQLQMLEKAPAVYALPAVQGNYFLGLTPGTDGSGGLSVYVLGQERPLAQFPDFRHRLQVNQWDRERFGAWKRFYFIPQARLIVFYPPSNDRLVLHRFDVKKALESSGVDYLLVTSLPVTVAKRGAAYKYPLEVTTNKKDVRYQLDSGPPGMEVLSNGLIQWSVPADFKDAETPVILTVRTAGGQETSHAYVIKIIGN
jgi:hypothetical protein